MGVSRAPQSPLLLPHTSVPQYLETLLDERMILNEVLSLLALLVQKYIY